MRRVALAAGVLLAASACGGSSTHAKVVCSSVAQPTPAPRTETAPGSLLDTAKTYDVVMLTSCGSFTIRLDPNQSPRAAASFVALARERYFDHTIIDRIVPGVLIEGGDPTASGKGGPGYTTLDKPPANASYGH